MSRFKIEDIVREESRSAADSFTCAVCMCLPEEPIQTVCQHLFCRECVEPLLACPLCRADFGEKKGTPLRECNRLLLNAMQGLKVGAAPGEFVSDVNVGVKLSCTSSTRYHRRM